MSIYRWEEPRFVGICSGVGHVKTASAATDVIYVVLRPSTPTFDYLPWQITHSF